jgi:putative ABC transport system permease protein
MSALLRAVRGDIRRRKLQGVVVAFVVLLSTLAGTVALDLLVESDAPFDQSFAQVNGAHLTLHFDSSRVSDAQLRATASLSSIEAAAGPWRETPLQITVPGRPDTNLDLVGRSDPQGPVDQLQLITGRWVAQPGEAVVARRTAEDLGVLVGDHISVAPGQGVGSLRVVGIAAAVNDTADAWVTPAQAAAITPVIVSAKGVTQPPGATVMTYRLHAASTPADIQTASDQVTRSLPADAVVGASNWLEQKISADVTTSVMIPFLIAFSVFALLAAAMIIGNVVSGAVIAGYREIGVMKSIGFTPVQVVVTFLVQVMIPAALGAVLGVVAGTLASQPFLAQTADAYNLPAPSPIVPWVLAAGLLVPLTVVLLASVIPGVRAARLSAAEALTSGSAPHIRRGLLIARALARLPFPRAVTLGTSDSITRPLRSGMTLVAVMIGVATITFATGLVGSLDLVKHALERDGQVQETVVRDTGPGGGGQALTDAQTVSLLQHQHGTRRFVAVSELDAHVSGIAPPIPVLGYRGVSSWIGYVLIDGRWFNRPGEAVAPTAFFRAADAHLGDMVMVSSAQHHTTVRLVGEIFDQQGDNILLRTDWSTIAALSLSATPGFYEINISGVSPQEYEAAFAEATVGYTVGVRGTGGSGYDTPFLLIETALGGLALVLTLCALAGVLNTVVLNTREKARDTAILKALGMTPRQVALMVLTSVTVIGTIGAAIGIPAGMVLHHQILVMMGNIAASTAIPPPFFSVFPLATMIGLAAAGVGVALLGALMPATWASRSRISTLLAPE